MYNAISIVIFHFNWKMQSDVWGSINDQGMVTHITRWHLTQSSVTINRWLRDFLWAQASQLIQFFGSSLSAYGLFFLGAHFVWTFSLMFLFSGCGYWQELIESIVWAHNKLKVVYFFFFQFLLSKNNKIIKNFKIIFLLKKIEKWLRRNWYWILIFMYTINFFINFYLIQFGFFRKIKN